MLLFSYLPTFVHWCNYANFWLISNTPEIELNSSFNSDSCNLVKIKEKLGACSAIEKFLVNPQAAAVVVVVTITIISISPET